MRQNTWNKCDVCGVFIAFDDFSNGSAIHQMISPDSDVSEEGFQTLCAIHAARHLNELATDVPNGVRSSEFVRLARKKI